jgi:hypothetical protein
MALFLEDLYYDRSKKRTQVGYLRYSVSQYALCFAESSLQPLHHFLQAK